MMIPKKPLDAKWTDDQWKAIYVDGCNILVSAGGYDPNYQLCPTFKFEDVGVIL